MIKKIEKNLYSSVQNSSLLQIILSRLIIRSPFQIKIDPNSIHSRFYLE